MSLYTTRLRDAAAQVCTRLGDPVCDQRSANTTPLDVVSDSSAASILDDVHGLIDSELESLLSDAAFLRRMSDVVISVAAGEVAKRSERSLGHSGLAQRNGHRGATQLVQSLTGESKGEASRQVKIGELMGETVAAERLVETRRPSTAEGGTDAPEDPRESSSPGPSAVLPWQHAVTTAIANGTCSAETGQVIIRTLAQVTDSCPDHERRNAAEHLVAIATSEGTTLDEVAREARCTRDRIDVEGIEERFTQRYEKRSLKTWHDHDGSLNVHAVCDDESGVFVTQLIDLAMSPRRGGPRFTRPDDISWSKEMTADPRTGEQLAFDTVIDVLRAGATCDDSTVFRTDRPAIRVITVVDAESSGFESLDHASCGHLEGADSAVPASFVRARECECGMVPITVDRDGRALNLGHSRRLFSSAQRVVLRARDGGCLWPRCDKPAWQTEAHHINPVAKGGRTDVADGVLLCAFHHLNLHNYGWRISRTGTNYFLHPPIVVGRPMPPVIPLRSKSEAWPARHAATG